MHQTNSGKSLKFVFSPTFIAQYVRIIVVWSILVFEKLVFSFDRSNMQIFTLNITRVV